jgi:hypothetical protein
MEVKLVEGVTTGELFIRITRLFDSFRSRTGGGYFGVLEKMGGKRRAVDADDCFVDGT